MDQSDRYLPKSAILVHLAGFDICFDYCSLYTVTSGDQFDNLQRLPRYSLAAPINCHLVWFSLNKISNEIKFFTTFDNFFDIVLLFFFSAPG